ncbi:MAG: ATP-binding protein [Nitrospirota bacterium]
MRQAVDDHPVVILTGARQVGKSTLLRHEEPFSTWRYVTLDDFDALHRAERDPAALWAGVDRVVLDEVQKSPALLSAVKQAVDRRRQVVRFVLSGSANLLLMRNVSETLAGRAVYFTLLPMALGELYGRPDSDLLRGVLRGVFPRERRIDTDESPVFHMLRGFMPALTTLSGTAAVLRWWEGYVATYLERDLRQLSQVDSLADFRRVMEALALRSGQMLNQTEVSRDTGVSQPTVHRYLNLLEASHLLVRIPAFARSRTTRLIKTPKLYWTDPGLAAYLAGHHEERTLSASREAGGLFETLVLLHLLVAVQAWLPRPRLFYWRTTTGQEVDFVIEHARKLLAIEVKLSATPRYSDAAGLQAFCHEYPEAVGGLLIHTGREVTRLAENIVAVPWHLLG